MGWCNHGSWQVPKSTRGFCTLGPRTADGANFHPEASARRRFASNPKAGKSHVPRFRGSKAVGEEGFSLSWGEASLFVLTLGRAICLTRPLIHTPVSPCKTLLDAPRVTRKHTAVCQVHKYSFPSCALHAWPNGDCFVVSGPLSSHAPSWALQDVWVNFILCWHGRATVPSWLVKHQCGSCREGN